MTDKRRTKRGERGILTIALEMRNGAGEALQDGTNLPLVRMRDAGAGVEETEAGAQGEVPARGNAHFPPGDAA